MVHVRQRQRRRKKKKESSLAKIPPLPAQKGPGPRRPSVLYQISLESIDRTHLVQQKEQNTTPEERQQMARARSRLAKLTNAGEVAGHYVSYSPHAHLPFDS